MAICQEELRRVCGSLSALMFRENYLAIAGMTAALLIATCAGGQTTSQGVGNALEAPLPGQPEKVFEVAAPLYDYSSPDLKPWHLKLSYQVYNEKGEPREPGTYEYWWASPDTYRSTWKRGTAEHTDWHMQGKHSWFQSGPSPEFYEWKIQSDIFEALPKPEDLNSKKVWFQRETKKIGNAKLPCIMVAPQMQLHGQVQTLPLGEFPTYCFEPTKPLLRVYFSYAGMSVIYGELEKVQGRILPKEFSVYDGNLRVVKVSLDSVNGIAANAPELTPAPEAKHGASRVQLDAIVEQGRLLKQTRPVYPQDAKEARASGRVVLGAVIGRDGHIHDLQVLEAPFPSLVAAAMIAVKDWEYKPYLLNGDPVEVETTVNVVFNLR